MFRSGFTQRRHKELNLTCSVNLLSSEADVKGVGRVPTTCQFDTKLGRWDTGQLPSCLTEICIL